MENHFRDKLEQELRKSLLDYRGKLTDDLRTQLLDLLHCIAKSNLGKRSDLKKLVGIALELLDNAQRYNSGKEVDFQWHIEDSTLVVTVRNKSNRKDAERLVNAIRSIDRMSEDEIAKAFRDQLTNKGFGEKGGAGLGMLQIARKVGKNITVNIHAVKKDEFICTSRVNAQLSTIRKRA